MNKISLSSELGIAFVIAIYCFGLYCLGFLIYGLILFDKDGIIASILFFIFWYLVFFRKIRRMESVTFDKESLYTKKGDKIGFNEIQSIVNHKITCQQNGIERIIFVNPYFPSKNHKLFYKYYKLKNQY